MAVNRYGANIQVVDFGKPWVKYKSGQFGKQTVSRRARGDALVFTNYNFPLAEIEFDQDGIWFPVEPRKPIVRDFENIRLRYLEPFIFLDSTVVDLSYDADSVECLVFDDRDKIFLPSSGRRDAQNYFFRSLVADQDIYIPPHYSGGYMETAYTLQDASPPIPTICYELWQNDDDYFNGEAVYDPALNTTGDIFRTIGYLVSHQKFGNLNGQSFRVPYGGERMRMYKQTVYDPGGTGNKGSYYRYSFGNFGGAR